MSEHEAALISGKLVDGVFRRVLSGELTPELVSQLAELGIDIHGPPRATYPRKSWHRAVDLTAQGLFPEVPLAVALHRLGGHIIEALQSRHVLKGPWLSIARLLGPRRALKEAMDFGDRSPIKFTIVELTKTELEIWTDDQEQPDFLVGLLEGAIAMLGGKSPKVSLKASQRRGHVFRASWR